ncbi:Flavocytochrome YedZ [Thalassovita autumnalis]|uniref:Protein-methionine-sulfoxide reductase heme-binding subunit MsrQ n=1 Tax=Thalassovita autumnalis TaxID=2072972 RepID=A0A0P1FA52_9RHOB|nr:protein-methionine-sulfoxide reductase heme-binding subunit MsrQ [Thalassovita autumnalis]CUH64941.1 Flavocytochrome YedZ [Thalassovita autumnalis]CUH71176.1 Flavocytochrome YedZ [Thalassovita autumnalis]
MVDLINRQARKLPTWVVYLIGFLPMPLLFWQGITGALGADPVKALEHEYGELALQLLILGLAITPARRHLGLNLLKFRRAIGLLSFFYVLAHLLVWAVLDVQTLGAVWADIVKRPYITIGMAGFALLLPLAVTSNNRSVRALGAGWRKLHKLTYPAVLLGGIHYVWLVKGWQLEPLIYLAAILFLFALRLPKRRKARVAA